MANAKQKVQKEITPYVPPITRRLEEKGGGPLTPAASLLSRMGKREVDDEVIAVVAWAVSFFDPKPHYSSCWDMGAAEKKMKSSKALVERIEKELLDDLGLEWHEEKMGGMILRPKLEFQQPETELPLWDVYQGKPAGRSKTEEYLGSTRGVSDIDAIQRYATWAKRTAVGMTAKPAKR